jgi:16S rRNA (cytosine967-C5)-methyltransferase
LFHVKQHPRRRIDDQTLPADGLAYAQLNAAHVVAVVLAGGNAAECFEHMRQAHPEWSDAARGAIRDLAWSALRDHGRGDAILHRLTRKPLPRQVHALLLVALSRIRRRPEQSHTVVDQAVDAAIRLAPGFRGVVNGILRNALRHSDEFDAALANDLVACHAYPHWWIERVRCQYPAGWQAILAAGNEHPPMSLRVNRRKISVDAYSDMLASIGIGARRLENGALLLARALPASRLPGFDGGLVSIQDAGAQWAALWLEAREGERVLDACAAPGGKTAHLLELVDIDLTALELDPVRAGRIRANLARLGLEGEVKVADCIDRAAWWDGRPFDRIMADVPCSGSGAVRRHPDIKWLRRESDIGHFAARQAQIIDALWPTLAPGGTMLYVTCSMFDEENHCQIERFLARHPDAKRGMLQGREPCFLTLLLSTDHDGFFFACLEKRG